MVNKFPNLPDIIKGGKFEQGKFDTLLVDKGDKLYSITVDFVRKLFNVYEVIDQIQPDILVKSYSFEDLI